MSRSPSPLPDGLGVAFRYDDARGLGVSPRRLRHTALAAPTRGLRIINSNTGIRDRAAAYLLMLPTAKVVFSHSTAAQLMGLSVPSDERLHVTLPYGVQVRRRGVVMHHAAATGVRRVDGLPVTSVLRTWLDMSTMLDLEDLVILGDAILQRAPALADALRRVPEQAPGRRGIRTAREAATLIRPGVLSPQETLWRLRFRQVGLPEPELNVTVRDLRGRWLGVGDFVWREQRLIAEYDGDYHFTVEQRRHDQSRRRAMRMGGWGVIELNGADNRNPRPALRAIAQALGRHLEM